MTQKILVLGGYGNFGKRIAQLLTRQNICVIIAGRDQDKAKALCASLPAGLAEYAVFDAKSDLAQQLPVLKPAVAINTCGPFQNSDYAIAQACIAERVHYIDLSDGRDFVTGIHVLDKAALKASVAVISGASTVPGLTSAVVEHYLPLFSKITSLRFGIAPGQKAERGLATTQAILGYVGKKLKPCAGFDTRYGWQDIYAQAYPELGRRWMANCDVPDLDILPARYRIEKIQFSAGMENPLVHLGIWVLSWLVRIGLPIQLAKHSAFLLKASTMFDAFGSADGGMHIIMQGQDHQEKPLERQWFIIARDGDGPYIPTIPAVILAKKLVDGTLARTGAMACVGMITLEEYLAELSMMNVMTYEFRAPDNVGITQGK